MFVKILGVKKSEYKGKDRQNKVGYTYIGMKEFTQYETENNEVEGHDVVREFSNTDYGLHVGDVVDFLFEPGFENRATLVGVRSVSPTDNPFINKEDGKDAKK